jgi:hypothetical protein
MSWRVHPIFNATDPAEAVATAIEQWGVVQLRDAVPLRRAVALSADAVDYFLVRKLPAGGGSILCAVPGAALGQEVDINVAILECVCGGPAGEAVRRYFRRACGIEEFIVPWQGLHVRVFAAGHDPKAVLPFHQDAYAFPHDWVMVNGWTLLYPAATGEDAAGLEFIPAPVTQLFEREKNPVHPTRAWMEISHADIAALGERYGTWVPKIELGDVMLFNQLAPHRTHCHNPTKPRLAVEVRMIAKTPVVVAEYGRNGIPYFTITPDGVVGPRRARIGPRIEALHEASARPGG